MVPLLTGGTMYSLLAGIQKKSPSYLIFSLLGTLLLIQAKTAAIFCFVILIVFFALFAKRKDLWVTSSIITAITVCVITFLIAMGKINTREFLNDSEHLQTFSDLRNNYNLSAQTTTAWRIEWWHTIVDDTMNQNPMCGTGLGSDITTRFLHTVMGVNTTSEFASTYARYPHCIIFTIFGRMGFLGLAFFTLLTTSIMVFCIGFARKYLRSGQEGNDPAILAMSIFLAGIANGFVQSTYEIPHGAILNWTCLGFLIAYRQRRRQSPSPNTNKNHSVSAEMDHHRKKLNKPPMHAG